MFFRLLSEMCSSATLHRYSATQQHYKHSMEVQANDTNMYIFFCCRAHDIIVAEQKNISMFMWCIEVLQSHTRFISFRLLFLFFHTHNQDFAGVQSRENRLPTQNIAMHKRINFCWRKNPDLSWYKEKEIRERGEIRGLILMCMS